MLDPITIRWRCKGQYFGYPKCCINSFCNEVVLRSQRRASNHSGFIPCKKHSKLILLKKITLKSLIRDRLEPKPFKS
jgi:hypothetical protein